MLRTSRVRDSRPVLERLRAVDRSRPGTNRIRAELALARHFRAAGREPLRIHWAPDASLRRLRELTQAYTCAEIPLSSRRLDPVRTPPYWTLSLDPLSVQSVDCPLPREVLHAAWDDSDLVLARPHMTGFDRTIHAELARSSALGGAWSLVCAPESRSVWEPLLEAFEAGLWIYWVFDEDVVAIPRPEVHTQNGRLHRDDGPAARWEGGGGERYFLEGVEVPKKYFQGLSAHQIRIIENVEVQRVLIRRYGESRFLQDAGAELAQEDDCGKLYHLEFLNDEPLAMVRVENSTPEPDGSRKPYFLRVPPRVRSAREGVAWTFGLEPGQYQPERET